MKRFIRIGAIALGVLIVIGLVLPRLIDVNNFRPRLESELSAALNRQVKVGNLSLSVFSGTVSADNISIGDDPAFSREPFVTAKRFKAGVNLKPLIFSKTLHITEITLAEPQITLLRGPGGTWNFSSLGGSSAARPPETSGKSGGDSGDLAVDKLTVEDGRLLIGTANSAEKPAVYDQVSLAVTNFSGSSQFPFTLVVSAPGGGELSLKGKCGPLASGDMGATPFEATMAAGKLDLAASGLASPATGIRGVANFTGSVNSDGSQIKTSGTLEVDKLQLAAKGAPSKRPVGLKYGLTFNRKSQAGSVTQGDVSIGKAVASLTGTYQMQDPSTALNMKVNGKNMPVDELEEALPALGVVLPSGSKLQGGALSLDMTITGRADQPVITGPIQLSNVKLAGSDMASKLSAIPALAGKQKGGKDTTIQNCSTTVRVAPEGTQANAINVTVAELGAVTGAGSIAPSGALNFKMTADMGGQGVPFMIEGTTADPKFVPDVKGIAGAAIARKVTGGEPRSGIIAKKRR